MTNNKYCAKVQKNQIAMMTALLTPGHYWNTLQKLRKKVLHASFSHQQIIDTYTWLFENGLVAELRNKSSNQTLVEFMITLDPADRELARTMRQCLEIAARVYAAKYFIKGINEEDKKPWLGYLANAIHFGNTAGDPDLIALRDMIKPSGWTFKKYGEHDYGSLTRRLQEAYAKEESAY